MPLVAIRDVADFVDGELPDRIDYVITGYPGLGIVDNKIRLGGRPRAKTGTLLNGEGQVELDYDSDTSYKVIQFAGVEGGLPFQIRLADAGLTLGQRIAGYIQRHPTLNPRVEYIPVPGRDGRPGAEGPQGRFDISQWIVTANTNDSDGEPTVPNPPADPVGGNYNVETATITPSQGASVNPTDPPNGSTLFKSIAPIDPATQSGDVTPVWSHWFEISSVVTHIQTGPRGEKGWSPIYATVVRGDDVVERLVAWVGGQGNPPGGIGEYRHSGGLTSDINDATNIRGPAGAGGSTPETPLEPDEEDASLDITSLPDIGAEGNPGLHSNGNLVVEAEGTNYRSAISRLIGLLKSSVGLGDRIAPEPHSEYAGQLLAYNRDGTRITHVPVPQGGVTHIARLPVVEDGAPSVAFLDEEYTPGQRQDANLRVAATQNFIGFNDPSVGGPAVGSINQSSWVVRVLCDGTTDDFSIRAIFGRSQEIVEEANEVWINNASYGLGDAFQQGGIWERQILLRPTNISNVDVDFNIRRADGTWVFTNGAGELVPSGLWVLPEGATEYELLAPPSLIVSNSPGAPSGTPTTNRRIHTDSLGRLWSVGGSITFESVAAEGTDAAFVNAKYERAPATRIDVFNDRGIGGFWMAHDVGNEDIGQFQGGIEDYVPNVRWPANWTWLISNVPGQNTAANRRLRDHSVMLGSFTSLADALSELSLILTTDEFATGANDYYYNRTGGDFVFRGIRRINTFTAATLERHNGLYFRGYHATLNDVDEWLEDNATHVKQILGITGGGGDADGVIDGLTLEINGQQLSATVSRTVGGDVDSNEITLPSGGGETATVLIDGNLAGLNTNYAAHGDVTLPASDAGGRVRVYTHLTGSGGSRAGAVAFVEIPINHIPVVVDGSGWNANDSDQRTFPLGANRSIGIGRIGGGEASRLAFAWQAGDAAYLKAEYLP